MSVAFRGDRFTSFKDVGGAELGWVQGTGSGDERLRWFDITVVPIGEPFEMGVENLGN